MMTSQDEILKSPLDVAHAAAWREYLISRIESAQSITLDLSGPDDCDSAGIQLLLSAQRTVEAEKKTLTIFRPDESIVTAATRLGIDFKNKFQVIEE